METERRRKAKREDAYILIPMELWNGEAFHALTKSEKLVPPECLAQLRYAPKGAKKRKKLPKDSLLKCGLGYLLNRGEFGLPTKYLQERCIKGEDTIARAKKKLVQVGFIDVVTQGSFSKAGRFRYSDRWRTYNSIVLLEEEGAPRHDGPLPGYCRYANIARHNDSKAENADRAVHANKGTYVQSDMFEQYRVSMPGGRPPNQNIYIGDYCKDQRERPP